MFIKGDIAWRYFSQQFALATINLNKENSILNRKYTSFCFDLFLFFGIGYFLYQSMVSF